MDVLEQTITYGRPLLKRTPATHFPRHFIPAIIYVSFVAHLLPSSYQTISGSWLSQPPRSDVLLSGGSSVKTEYHRDRLASAKYIKSKSLFSQVSIYTFG